MLSVKLSVLSMMRQFVQGFHPEDFQRSGARGGTHPDIAQPGPGTTDWDSMYG